MIQTCQLIFNKQDEISIEHDCVLWGACVIIPSRGRERVFELLHESHPGIVKMKSIARRVCWWPKLDYDIESCVHNCGNCQAMTAVPSLSSVHPLEWTVKPCVRIHVDCCRSNVPYCYWQLFKMVRNHTYRLNDS